MLGNAGPRLRLLLQQSEPFMERHLRSWQPADAWEDMELEGPQDVVMPFLVLRAIGLIPLTKERLDRICFEDRLLLQQADHLRIVALLKPGPSAAALHHVPA